MKHWQANEKWTLGKIYHFSTTERIQTPNFFQKSTSLEPRWDGVDDDRPILRRPNDDEFKKIVCKRNIEIKSSNVERMMMGIL